MLRPLRPRFAATLIGLAAQALFTFRLAVPHKLVFDEVHYAVAARFILGLEGPRNIEHPLLGKTLIALGMWLFGDNPVGWRAMSTVAGTATVVGSFTILWLLFARLRTAVVGSLLVLLNFTVFVQARIAMLDGFMAALVVWGLALLLWSGRAVGHRAWRRWIAGALLLGLATGTKWTAAPYVAFAAAGFAWARWRRPAMFPALPLLPGLGVLGAVSVTAYFLTFLPAFFYHASPLTLAGLLPFQLAMFHQQTQVLPPHTYQSGWWTWAIEYRPIWYLYEPADGAQRGILMLGNPAIMWAGLLALVVVLWRGTSASRTLALLWLASWLMWGLIPKSLGFYYYYYLSSIWLPLVIAAAFHDAGPRWRYWDEGFLLLSAVLFVHFYPILAATPLAGPDAFHRWTWFASWV